MTSLTDPLMVNLWVPGGLRKAAGWHTFINVTKPKARTAELIDTATLRRRRVEKAAFAQAKPVPVDDFEAAKACIDRALERNPRKKRCHASALEALKARAHIALIKTELN